MPSDVINVFIQARMNSQRFPGKVLAPFCGKPIIKWVTDAVESLFAKPQIFVLTSVEVCDDPLAAYLAQQGTQCFRGELDRVFCRFQACAERFPSMWILRISADSPLLDLDIIRSVVAFASDPMLDLVTTIFPRTFPKGLNAELIRTRSLIDINASELSSYELEHVTPYFYNHAEQFAIKNISSSRHYTADESFAVDTLDDYFRLSRLMQAGFESVRS
jgi:spore coat polysaccharide biosynthesis protein SpsF